MASIFRNLRRTQGWALPAVAVVLLGCQVSSGPTDPGTMAGGAGGQAGGAGGQAAGAGGQAADAAATDAGGQTMDAAATDAAGQAADAAAGEAGGDRPVDGPQPDAPAGDARSTSDLADARCGEASGPCCGVIRPGCNGPDLVCVASAASTCQRCGQLGGPCCLASRCNTGCCGLTADWKKVCVAPGASCGSSPETTCTASGSCGTCGGSNQECCRNQGHLFCTAAGTDCLFENSPLRMRCLPCGGAGESCCLANPSMSATSSNAVCSPGFTCAFGRCR